jgi:hypothetical protein
MRQTTFAPAWPSLRDGRGRLLGLPFVVATFPPGLVFGWQAMIAALAIASVASFLVYVPITVLVLNGGDALAEDAPVPALTPRAYAALLALFTFTAWAGPPWRRTCAELNVDARSTGHGRRRAGSCVVALSPVPQNREGFNRPAREM